MTAQEIELIRQLLEKVNRLERRIGLADTLELASGGGVYTNEEAQDAVGTILTDTATIDFTYTDATPSITADVKTDSITNTLLSNMAANTIKGRANGAGTGDPTDLTATQVRTIINVENGADVTDAGNIASSVTGVSTDDTIVDADVWGYLTSGALVKTTWSNIKAVLKTYFDTLYGLLGTANTWTKNNTIASTTTSGNALRVVRDLGSASTDAPVVDFVQDNTGDDQPALRIQQDGTGNIANLHDGATLVVQVVDGGKMAVGSAITTPAGVLHAGASAFLDTVLFERTGQTLDVFVASMRLLVTKTTNMADGFGPAITLAIQDDAGVINAIGAIGAIRAGADNTGNLVLAPTVAGTTVPMVWVRATGGIEVLQPTLGGVVQKLYSTATNDDPTELFYQNRVTTTDATVTTLHTFTVPTSTSYMVEVVVIARRTGGIAGAAEDGAGYKLLGLYKNTAGTVAIIGAVVQTVVGESQAGWDATLDTTGATVRVRVTGAANNNVTWHVGAARVWQVAS